MGAKGSRNATEDVVPMSAAEAAMVKSVANHFSDADVAGGGSKKWLSVGNSSFYLNSQEAEAVVESLANSPRTFCHTEESVADSVAGSIAALAEVESSESGSGTNSKATSFAESTLQATTDIGDADWRHGAKLADHTLAWGGSEWKAHRWVLGGQCRYFEGIEADRTDLSQLLPTIFKDSLPTALDFIYGNGLGELDPRELPALFKIADVLQCDTLKKFVLDEVYRMTGSPESNTAVTEAPSMLWEPLKCCFEFLKAFDW